MLPAEFLPKKYNYENLPPKTLKALAWIALEGSDIHTAIKFDRLADTKLEKERDAIVNSRPETD